MFAEGAVRSFTRLFDGRLTCPCVRYGEASPVDVAIGPRSAVRAISQRAHRLVRIDPGGQLESIALPRSARSPSDVLVRADSSVRILPFRGHRRVGYAVGRFDEFPTEGQSAGLGGPAATPDGAPKFAMARRTTAPTGTSPRAEAAASPVRAVHASSPDRRYPPTSTRPAARRPPNRARNLARGGSGSASGCGVPATDFGPPRAEGRRRETAPSNVGEVPPSGTRRLRIVRPASRPARPRRSRNCQSWFL